MALSGSLPFACNRRWRARLLRCCEVPLLDESVSSQHSLLTILNQYPKYSQWLRPYASVFDNIAKGLVTKLGCELELPRPTGDKEVDPSSLVVTYTPGNGSGSKPLTQVTDASKCGSDPDGWYYDNPARPTKIVFCPAACSGPGTDTGGKIDIAVGCAAPPPK